MVQRDVNGGAARAGNDWAQARYSTQIPAANDARPVDASRSLSDAQLLDYLKRSLAGEPFPVSAPRDQAATRDLPLALRVREILRAENENQSVAPPLPESLADLPAVEAPEPHEPAQPLPSVVAYPVTAAVPSRRRSTVAWGSTALILFATLSAAYIPSLTASPPRYAAEARLQVQGAARTTRGFLDATTLGLTSPRLLSRVVTGLKLDQDAEFTGGAATFYSVLKDLLTDSGAAADHFSRAQFALRQKLTVTQDPRSATVVLAVQSTDSKTSARIANFLADLAVRDAAAKPPVNTPSPSEQVLDSERKHYDAATAALTAFKASAGEEKIAAATDVMVRRQALANQLASARSAAQAASIRLTAAKSVKLSDVLEGAISPDLGSPAALEDLRNRYAAARTTLGQLSTQLGPRHPRLLAAQSILDTLSASITAEIRKIVAATDADGRTTASQVKLLTDRLAALDQQPTEVDMAAFGKLQADVETARQAYETAMTATQDIQPEAKATAPLALIAPAVPAAAPIDDNLRARTLIGGAIGFGVALILVAGRLLLTRRSPRPSFDEDAFDLENVDLLADIVDEQTPVRAPLDQPRQRFDAAMAVANDRRIDTPEPERHQPETPLAAIIDDVASLRERVASYALRRQGAGR